MADAPDRGRLMDYAPGRALRKGAATWHAVDVSEAHALRAIASGKMLVQAPDGRPIELRYERHVEHADGNWTWIGRPAGAQPGVVAMVTFGDRAVFGTIPQAGKAPLELTTVGGHSWLLESSGNAPAAAGIAASDFLEAPTAMPNTGARRTVGSAAGMTSAAMTVQSSTPTTTVDLLLGYTTGFATRLGGQSQAVTRLTFMVDTANQALANSGVTGQLRLVGTQQVDYPDATTNRSALFELTGVSCTSALGGQLPDGGVSCTQVGQPASLQPLIAAREQYGADLVSLVRTFQSPENQSCGLGWLLGGGQTTVTAANSAAFGMSVVSDTSGNTFPDPEGGTCRNDNLAHELGHNFGLQHDRETAAGSDDTNTDGDLLDPEEFGRFPYAFGYVAAPDAGNFFDVMAIRRTGLDSFLIYSNPRLTCGSFPCGVADVADSARALATTLPVVATFRAPVQPLPQNWVSGDYNGDGSADVLWRNSLSGSNSIWKSANSATFQGVAAVTTQTWGVVGVGDFNGDGKSDILWRNRTTGANGVWLSANAATPLAVRSITDTAWIVAGIGDFDGDGKSDILWRNRTTGANGIWKSANALTPQAVTTVGNTAWTVAGIGDFDGDGKSDIFWRNGATGANGIWRSANSATPLAVTAVNNLAWSVVGVGDFDGDHHSDVLWRSAATGANGIWKSANSATPMAVASVTNFSWTVVGIGDYNNDGLDDVLWRNFITGDNGIWRSSNAATPQAVTAIPDQTWFVAG